MMVAPRLRLVISIVLSATLGLAADSAFARPAAVESPEVRELVRLVNAHREAIGCPPLIWDPRLAAVARRHSEDMARRGFFAHDDPAGRTPFDRIQDAMVEYAAAGENIAAGQSSAPEVLRSWLSSRGHRANLEDCGFTHHGIGFYRNRWTHVFVTLLPE